ncbi:ParB/RepB/Spo0J family plasmid partition protein [Salmonella enterica]|uniref:ParB/RepB/Spo0J family plasmid partition protein n=1 Tax=Salmonella enteritidis TaxID=149539 RepID=A0A5Y0DZG7_SALEN|nr:ParB/RepB/Spo0J family plasmid partition protein [Salmonella enterica subsp. enterica serovar Enteritidis]EAM1540136.1 ParB/RepB/Spo0J family plasmid partition protein [Salmonella enterica]EBN3457269.1 ParB/RepB/Spo0J family plasmid partition protein [Salmonella enterica subsp. enterica serovar Newport]EAN8797604.1 ParB/RepB/Spo0J family plasmid partition protein [Salmonella enterica]EAP2490032.1 ParB/RepB/Spo0J family plasmid partition protein [Salmonella enterica]
MSERVRNMVGNHVTLPVCGRDVTFTLETVAAEMVERATMVWSGNERDQALLTQAALDDLIPSFLTSGQQNPALGRKISGIIEVADGSRRRQTAIYTHSEYRVLVGDLDDEQMAWLSTIGNSYRQTSSYERGKRYARRLKNEFGDNVSKLAEAENISRKIIMRCIKTAELPRKIIALFSNPNELSARAGESLAKVYAGNEDAVLAFAQHLAKRQKDGESFETDEILKQLHNVAEKPTKPATRERLFGQGIKAKYKGDSVSFQLNNVSPVVIQKIETLLKEYQEEQQKLVSEAVDDAFVEIDTVTNFIRAAATGIDYDIPANELQTMIPFSRTVLKEHTNEADRIKRIADEITRRYII